VAREAKKKTIGDKRAIAKAQWPIKKYGEADQ
jgi:hypothetical protein